MIGHFQRRGWWWSACRTRPSASGAGRTTRRCMCWGTGIAGVGQFAWCCSATTAATEICAMVSQTLYTLFIYLPFIPITMCIFKNHTYVIFHIFVITCSVGQSVWHGAKMGRILILVCLFMVEQNAISTTVSAHYLSINFVKIKSHELNWM